MGSVIDCADIVKCTCRSNGNPRGGLHPGRDQGAERGDDIIILLTDRRHPANHRHSNETRNETAIQAASQRHSQSCLNSRACSTKRQLSPSPGYVEGKVKRGKEKGIHNDQEILDYERGRSSFFRAGSLRRSKSGNTKRGSWSSSRRSHHPQESRDELDEGSPPGSTLPTEHDHSRRLDRKWADYQRPTTAGAKTSEVLASVRYILPIAYPIKFERIFVHQNWYLHRNTTPG